MANSIARSPMITIITSTFQAAKDLPITAASIRSQTYKNVQWIIADGGSSDGTVEWIQANLDVVSDWFSSPDQGIYDAWNKALPLIKGEWVQFLGAGDELYSSDTLDGLVPILAKAYPQYEIVYGGIKFVTSTNRQIVQSRLLDWHYMKNRWELMRPMLPVHPEVFHHRQLFDNGEKFDLRFKIAGDSHFLLKAISKKRPLFAPVYIDKMQVGGSSAQLKNALIVLKEIELINRDLGITPPALVVLSSYFRAYCRYFLSLSFLPQRLVSTLINFTRMLRGRKPLSCDAQ